MLAFVGPAVDAEIHNCVDKKQQGQELQQQKQVLPQPLEQRVDVQIFDALAPQKGARHAERLALELEEVKQHHGNRHEQQDESQPPGKGNVVRQVIAAQFLIHFSLRPEDVESKQGDAGNRQQNEHQECQREPRTGQAGPG